MRRRLRRLRSGCSVQSLLNYQSIVLPDGKKCKKKHTGEASAGVRGDVAKRCGGCGGRGSVFGELVGSADVGARSAAAAALEVAAAVERATVAVAAGLESALEVDGSTAAVVIVAALAPATEIDEGEAGGGMLIVRPRVTAVEPTAVAAAAKAIEATLADVKLLVDG